MKYNDEKLITTMIKNYCTSKGILYKDKDIEYWSNNLFNIIYSIGGTASEDIIFRMLPEYFRIKKLKIDYKTFREMLIKKAQYSILYKGNEYNIRQYTNISEIHFIFSDGGKYIFYDVDDLLNVKLIDGKTLYEIWEDVTIY